MQPLPAYRFVSGLFQLLKDTPVDLNQPLSGCLATSLGCDHDWQGDFLKRTQSGRHASCRLARGRALRVGGACGWLSGEPMHTIFNTYSMQAFLYFNFVV